MLAELRAGPTRLRWDPAMRQVALAEVWGALNAGKLRLDKTAEAELVTLVKNRTTASRLGLPESAPLPVLVRGAEEKVARWRRLELDAAPVVARQASTVREAFEDLLFPAEPDPPEAGPGAYEE